MRHQMAIVQHSSVLLNLKAPLKSQSYREGLASPKKSGSIDFKPLCSNEVKHDIRMLIVPWRNIRITSCTKNPSD